MTAITTVTAQNTLGVKESVDLEPRFIRAQIETVAGDIQVDACKTGLLATSDIVAAVASAIKDNKLIPLVIDPVMFTKSGTKLVKDETVAALRTLLIPQATLVAPNLRETLLLLSSNAEPTSLNLSPPPKMRPAASSSLGPRRC
jgi:hydroxymethylpyrimidine/phosphomethylpyrimidine kinase